MLLSSAAEAIFWTGRYIERAQALARTVQAYERLSLDLPGARWLDLRPLLGLRESEGLPDPGRTTGASGHLHDLVLDGGNPSSVLGAVCQARANLRRGRVVTPLEVWATLNGVYVRLSEVDAGQTAGVLDALEDVVAAGSRIEGELTAGMTRDAVYSFWRLGCYLERADMLVRTMKALLPVIGPGGPERVFDDLRWMGLLEAVGAHSMYRRRHHTRVDLQAVLEFLVLEASFPRSLTHCLYVVDEELRNLGRPVEPHAERSTALQAALVLGRTPAPGVSAQLDLVLSALAGVHGALKASYFPDLAEPSLAVASLRPELQPVPPVPPRGAERSSAPASERREVRSNGVDHA